MKKKSRTSARASATPGLRLPPLVQLAARPRALGGLDAELGIFSTRRWGTPWAKLTSDAGRALDVGAAGAWSRQMVGPVAEVTAPRALGVGFPAGGATRALFVPPATSTFALHSAIRAHFTDLVARDAVPAGQPAAPWRLRVDLSGLPVAEAERALFAVGFLQATARWKPEAFGKKAEEARKATCENVFPEEVELRSALPRARAEATWKRAEVLGRANNRVRRLAELPPNELHPISYRAEIQRLAREAGLAYEFADVRELRRRGAGAFLAVARASDAQGAGIVKLTYSPKGGSAKTAGARRALALVGKGLCFDTGGYNIKTGAYMHGMHGDMTGSAVALSLTLALAELGFPHPVTTRLAITENLISPTAYKPNEVVVASDGTAIEVVDTDAEGRMVLADTLAFARKEEPRLILDFATLTGAVIRAIDTRRGGLFSNRPRLRALAMDCGDAVGERVWGFPIGEDYLEQLKSRSGDLLQCAPGNNSDHIYAATFLSHFAGAETPWAHLDLAAAENKGGLGLIATDTTGFGLLWAEEFVRRAMDLGDAALGISAGRHAPAP